MFGPGRYVPALLALYQDVETDASAGIHRIKLTPDVFAGAKVERLSLGRWPTPRAIKLWPMDGNRLFVGEGLETVLAAALRHRLPRRAHAPGLGNRAARRPRQAAGHA